jgi:alpha-ketoglutaric semialdehyde dehydrogenase
MFKDTTPAELNAVMENATHAFQYYKKTSLKQRADFLRAIAGAIESLGDELLQTAHAESNLPIARLTGERARTIFQLTSYATATENGQYLGASIDTALPNRTPPKPDLRKMLVPLGPIVVFGASNFPLAFSTAGGDTAAALAAGCPVIVKAHPAHAKTSKLMASAIASAAKNCNLPDGVFAHVYGAGNEVGGYLVKHDSVKAVAFTGSFDGGKALFDCANQRKVPIPVFAEMGSVNPIFLLPEKLAMATDQLAKDLAGSITLGMGQFCTNPGIIIAVASDTLDKFLLYLKKEIESIAPALMLHEGIANHYQQRLATAKSQKGIQLIGESKPAKENQGQITIATVAADNFLTNPIFHQEVFGPYSLVVQCKDEAQFLTVAKVIEGQLTVSLMGTEQELKVHQELIDVVQEICGRLILNQLPTGVEVSLSMHHGGPFPASTDSRFTSVGADGIKRFARPLCFQNWTNELLPDELKNENPLNIWRTVNDVLTKEHLPE